MLTKSKPPRRVAAVISLALFAGSFLSACSQQSSDDSRPMPTTSASSTCSTGAPNAISSLQGFLVAAGENNLEGAKRFRQQGGSVPASAWDTLAKRVKGAQVSEMNFSADRMGGTSMIRVVAGDGTVVGDFQVSEQQDSPGCFAVVWGEYHQQSPAEHSETASV